MTTRKGLLTQVVGWNDPRYTNNAELGRQAGVTGEAVRQLREELAAEDDAEVAS